MEPAEEVRFGTPMISYYHRKPRVHNLCLRFRFTVDAKSCLPAHWNIVKYGLVRTFSIFLRGLRDPRER